MNFIKRNILNIFHVMVWQVVSACGSLLAIKVLTGLMPPNLYGELVLLMTAPGLILQFLAGPIGSGIIRYGVISNTKTQKIKFLKSIYGISNYLALATTLLFFVALIICLFGYFHFIIPILLIMVLTIASNYNGIIYSVNLSRQKQVLVSMMQAIENIIRPLFAGLIIINFKNEINYAIFGYILASLLILSINIYLTGGVRFDLLKKLSIDKSMTRNIFKYAWPFSLWGIFSWVQITSDKWAIFAFIDNETVGLYNVASQLGYYPIVILFGAIIQYLAPIFFKQIDSSNTKNINNLRKNINILTFFGIIITLFMIIISLFFGDYILKLFANKYYINASNYLPFMVYAGGVFSIAQLNTLLAQANIDSAILIAPKIGASVLGVIINFIGAYYYGINGVLWAMVIYSTAYYAWVKFSVRNI